MKQKVSVKQVLVMATLTSSTACVLATLTTVINYRHLYGLDCGTGRMAAVGDTFAIPLLLIPPFLCWRGKGFSVVSPRAAARVILWPSIIWFAAFTMILLMENARVFLR